VRTSDKNEAVRLQIEQANRKKECFPVGDLFFSLDRPLMGDTISTTLRNHKLAQRTGIGIH
jgi:hypothetical protein